MVNGNKTITRNAQFINSDHELRKVMKLAGMYYVDRVIRHNGAGQRFIVNEEAKRIILTNIQEKGEEASASINSALIRGWEELGKKVCARLRKIGEVEFGSNEKSM